MGITTTKRSARRGKPAAATLAGALFSTTQQRVLGLLFGQPERSYFATELIGLAHAGSGAVQRELQRLAESGLVTVSQVGNQKHYQANRQSPVFEELHGIAVKALGPAEALRSALAPLASRVRAAWLYGSVAKGHDRASSDMDVMIVSDDVLLEDIYKILRPAENLLGRTVNPTLYSTAEFKRRLAAKSPFLTKVLSGKRILLIGDEDVLGSTR